MFKLTYNQVRQFIKKSVLYDMRSYVESGLGARITSLLVATFFMIPLVMIVGIGTTISLDNLFGINIPLLSKIFVPNIYYYRVFIRIRFSNIRVYSKKEYC